MDLKFTVTPPVQAVEGKARFVVDLNSKRVIVQYSANQMMVPQTHIHTITEAEYNALKAILRPILLEVPGITNVSDPSFGDTGEGA